MVGKTLQKYEILEEIGQGGMAVVYRGRDLKLDRDVAVKVLHSHLAAREEALERFQREAHAVARLRHENILEIYDYSGKESERSFIVMELIHGPTLKTFLDDHPITVPEVGMMVVTELCGALSHAHAAGIIHRDIKPENVMVRQDGVLKLMDFGIAAMVDTQKLTVTGQLLGSPAYMAPEMVTGERLDFRTDVFSLGILLYRLAVGELPFKGKNPHEVLKRIAEVDYIPASIANPKVGEGLARVIEKALARRPQQRFESVDALRQALTALLGEVELEDPRRLSRRFLADPEGFQADLAPALVERLVRVAQREIRSGSHARAFSRLNRVLALDPENQEVRALLRQIGRSRAVRSFLKIGLLALFIIATGLAVMALVDHVRTPSASAPRGAPSADATRDGGAFTQALPQGDPDSGSGPEAVSSSPAQDGSAPRAADATPARRGAFSPRMAPRRGVGVRPASVARRTLRLQVTPLIWTLFLDGKRISQVPGTPATIEVGPGDHLLEFRDESGSAYAWQYPVTRQQRDHTVNHRLRWHPARLQITGSPRDATLQFLSPAYLARRLPTRIGTPVVVPILNPGEGGVKAKVRVYRTGYHEMQRTVTFWPNKTRRLTVNLKPLR